MKIASCVLLPDSNVTIFAYRGNGLEGTLHDIAGADYDGVELFVRDPDSLEQGKLDQLLEQTGLEVCGVGTAVLNAQDKITLTNPDSEKRRIALQKSKRLIDFAAHYGSIPLDIGKFRGNFPPDRRVEGWCWLREAFLELCDYAAKKKVMVALEPQERGNLNNLNSTHDGIMWVEQIGAENLGLLLDTFHMNLEDDSPALGILEGSKYLMHVHASDTNRLAPGKGTLDFIEVVRALHSVGYKGYLTVEIAQPPEALETAAFACRHLRNIITMY